MANNDNVTRPTDPLAAAVEALGLVMHALNGRALLDRMPLGPLREKLMEQGKSDEELLAIASDAFESGAIALAAAGHPGAVAFTCGESEIAT